MTTNGRRLSLHYGYSDCWREVTAMKITKMTCDCCGVTFSKRTTQINKHNFCCRNHFYRWNAERISNYNSTDNPMNKPGGVMESRLRRGEALRGCGEKKTYRKFLGTHEHRRVAESTLGRPLRKGEVVHHIDGDKFNNAPENLLVMPSQAEHARLHAVESALGHRVGKARKGVIQNENIQK
jgi:hypothetical protein